MEQEEKKLTRSDLIGMSHEDLSVYYNTMGMNSLGMVSVSLEDLLHDRKGLLDSFNYFGLLVINVIPAASLQEYHYVCIREGFTVVHEGEPIPLYHMFIDKDENGKVISGDLIPATSTKIGSDSVVH